jgi:hypothetical protein
MKNGRWPHDPRRRCLSCAELVVRKRHQNIKRQKTVDLAIHGLMLLVASVLRHAPFPERGWSEEEQA